MNRPLFVILAAVTLDSIGIGLIFPILPSLLEDVTHTAEVATLYGVLLAIYAAMQFLFSPVLGMLSDRFGRRPVLLVSLAGAAIDYLIMAFAPQLWLLVVGRAIAGLSSANMAVATAYITDITPEAQRAQRFGLFHAMFGIGFIVGPVLGGFLGDYWVRLPFIAAAILNGLNFALALFVLPESRPGNNEAKFQFRQLNPFRSLGWALGIKPLLPFIGIFFLFNFIGQIYGTVWALYGQHRFGWDMLTIGLSLGAYGICHAAVQIFLPGPAAARFGERNAMFIGMACECVALAVTGVTSQGWVVFALAPFFALGGIGVPALQSLATRQVEPEKQGELQGVLASSMSIASIIGPLFFSSIYFITSGAVPGAVWFAAVVVYVLTVPVMLGIPAKPRPAAGT